MTSASSRRRVLDALRQSSPAPVPLPAVERDSRPGDIEEFERRLERAGAIVQPWAGDHDLGERLAAHGPFAEARRVVSAVPGVPGAELGTETSSDPHSFADVDVAIARGEFGVAENGAIWVTDAAVPHRALYFLAQHLVLLVSSAEVVADLHAAYARIDRVAAGSGDGARGSGIAWGGFIAGPSKTADIEQALVVGAHGPRSLLVLLD